MARGGIPASPLPQRRGVDAMRLRMPQEGPWLTLRDHLVDRIPALDPERIDAMLAAGEFVGIDGMPCAPDAPFVPRSVVWVHRDLPDEVPVPSRSRCSTRTSGSSSSTNHRSWRRCRAGCM
ncbi:MAG: hypothetical protein IPL93_08835 [Actinomycetales bacterium]|nr:hypothetical protein [Actinomycetales bacterium]